MKEYLLIAKGSRAIWDSTNEKDWESVMTVFNTRIGSLKEKNLWIRGDRLRTKRVDIAKVKNGFSTSDGPFTETKELDWTQMANFFF